LAQGVRDRLPFRHGDSRRSKTEKGVCSKSKTGTRRIDLDQCSIVAPYETSHLSRPFHTFITRTKEVLMARTMPALLGAAAGLAIVIATGTQTTSIVGEACAAEAKVSFANDILPLFKWRCGNCHQSSGAGYEKSGLDLNSYEGVMKGTRFGPMVIPRDPESSNLMLLLDWRASPQLRMPHGKKKLSICDRDAVRTWIREGALNN
jgi:hypothetical protein